VEPRRRRRRGRLHQHLRRQAGLDLNRRGRLSAPTLNWLRWPDGPATEPTAEWPLETLLDAVSGAGFESVGLDHYTLAACGGSLDDVAAMLAARGLRCSDVGIAAIGALDTSALARLTRAAAVLRAPICIAALFADAPHDDAVRDLRAAAAALAPAGTRLAFEFTSYGHARTLAAAAAVCEDVGWERCGLLVDSWHVFRGGEELSSVAALTGNRIALVHVSDGGALPHSDPVLDGRFRRRLPGTGSFDLAGFAAALAAAGYDGTVSPEVLSPALRRLEPSEGARRLRASLERVPLRSLSTRDRASRGTRRHPRPRRSSSA
jgi:sugar phosphate isomerase/epimerase